MDARATSIAKKIKDNKSLYSYLDRWYYSRSHRKTIYRKIATQLVEEGVVHRITPAQVKKIYYSLRAHYRRIQKRINLNPELHVPQLNHFDADIYTNMAFLQYYVHYNNGMRNH